MLKQGYCFWGVCLHSRMKIPWVCTRTFKKTTPLWCNYTQCTVPLSEVAICVCYMTVPQLLCIAVDLGFDRGDF